MSSFDIAWEEFPTASTTLVFPIQKAEFPTVTLCQKNNNPDRWGAAIKIFDYLDRSCSPERYKECNINGLWKWGKKIYKPRLIMAHVRYKNPSILTKYNLVAVLP